MIYKAYDELGANERSMGCPIDLLKVIEDQDIYFTDDEIEFDHAFIGLLCDELQKKVDWFFFFKSIIFFSRWAIAQSNFPWKEI